MDADGATDINDLKKLYDAIKKQEKTIPSLGVESQGFALGSRSSQFAM